MIRKISRVNHIGSGITVSAPSAMVTPAMWFAGDNDYVTTPITVALNGAATISCWIWMPSLPSEAGRVLYQNSWFYLHFVNNYLYLANGAIMRWDIAFAKRTWTHLSMSWNGNGSSAKVWKNSVVQTALSPNTNDITARALNLGSNSIGTSNALGVIRQCYYWNRQVSDAEALAIYQGNPPTPTGYWRGNGNTDAGWTDQSGNGYNGTVYGSPQAALIYPNGDVYVGGVKQ